VPGTLVIRDVELAIAPGEALGLAGESGCGKSTLRVSAPGRERRSERRVHRRPDTADGVDLFQARPKPCATSGESVSLSFPRMAPAR